MKTLDPDLLLRAYSIGVFPMSDGRDAQDLYWVEPRHRAIQRSEAQQTQIDDGDRADDKRDREDVH